MIIKQRINACFAVFSAILLAFNTPGMAETIGKSIATVNGEAIYMAEFQNNWESILEQQKEAAGADKAPTSEWVKKNKKLLLDQMVEEKLLLQEANRKAIKVPKRQLEEGVMQVKNRFKSLSPGTKPTKEDYERDLTPQERAEFDKELKKQGITEKEFTSKIEDQLKVMRLTEDAVRANIPPPFKDDRPVSGEDTERELSPAYERESKALYDEIEKRFNKKDFKPMPDDDIDEMTSLLRQKLGESVHARHILVKSSRSEDMKKRTAARTKAVEYKKQLDGGADFVELAKKVSDGPSAKTGGDLGFFTHGQMVPEFEKVAFSLPVGGISDVIETEFGFHIVQVEEKKAAKRLRYDDIKMDLAGYLYQKKSKDAYEKFIAELRKKADIKVLADLEKLP